VTVVWAPAVRTVQEVTLELPEGATAAQALAHTGWTDAQDVAQRDPRALSVWGRAVAGDAPLRDGDRLEVTRPLRVDPKVARRERFARQGARAPGLFARPPRPR
jgi:putative ubiquitin-RnfH superfamily antitoxin RatB of RatAB toxin-antitoxin module